jgi:hypothetical protein
MNVIQRLITIGTFGCLILAALYPEWRKEFAQSYSNSGVSHIDRSIGSRYIFSGPKDGFARIDAGLLLAKALIIASVGGLLFVCSGFLSQYLQQIGVDDPSTPSPPPV